MAEGPLKVTSVEKPPSFGANHKTPPDKGWWTLAKILSASAIAFFIATIGGVAGLFMYISNQTSRLDTKIHNESTAIRELVGGNTNKLGRLDERVTHVKDTTDRIDQKLDRLLMERQKANLSKQLQ